MVTRSTIYGIYPLMLSALMGSEVLAAEWDAGAGIGASIEYTDNVCLSSDNEEGDWVGKVTPDVDITGSGNKANVSLRGSVELNTLSDSDLEDQGCGGRGVYSNRDQFAPDLSATADAILVDNWLFIDADASARQNSVSPFGAGGGDSLDRRGNSNTTYRYSVTPYIERSFKDAADLELRYTYDEQYNSKDIVGDSSEQTVLFNLASGPRFAPISWGLQGDYSKVEYDARQDNELNRNRDSELKSARFNLGYQFDRVWQINGYIGQEWNDFVSFRDDIDGEFWDVGFRWTPNERTVVEAGTGDRFFGATPRFAITHRHKRSVLTAAYKRDLTYSRNIRTLDDPSTGGGATALTNSPILDERFTLAYAYEGRRSGLSINASHSDQTRQGGQTIPGEDFGFTESTFMRLGINVNRSLSRKLSLSGSVSWDKEEPKDSADIVIGDSETWRAYFRVERPLGENTTLSFNYQYTDRQSDSRVQPGSQFGDYTENLFTLTLRVGF